MLIRCRFRFSGIVLVFERIAPRWLPLSQMRAIIVIIYAITPLQFFTPLRPPLSLFCHACSGFTMALCWSLPLIYQYLRFAITLIELLPRRLIRPHATPPLIDRRLLMLFTLATDSCRLYHTTAAATLIFFIISLRQRFLTLRRFFAADCFLHAATLSLLTPLTRHYIYTLFAELRRCRQLIFRRFELPLFTPPFAAFF